ncbi:MAG: hypothetical protein NZ571_04465 [Anaerolineae bacterium]|nr:hypothetical protein [Anaerolineae bacterium]
MGEIVPVTNMPTPAKGIRIPQYVIILAVLLFSLGALLALSQGIDERAFVRAEFTATPTITPTPIDPFANLTYTLWRSEGDLISMEIPASWQVQPSTDSPVGYTFSVPQVTNTGIGLLVLPIAELGVPNLPADASPETILKTAIPSEAERVRAVEAGNLKGAGLKQSEANVDQRTGELVGTDRELWLLSIDSKHVMLLQALAPTQRWAQMEEVFTRAMRTLNVNVEAVVARFASAATAEPTAEATAQPTAEATAQPTVEATTQPTAEATAQPTVEPTAEATRAPTATPEPAGPPMPTAAPSPTPAN